MWEAGKEEGALFQGSLSFATFLSQEEEFRGSDPLESCYAVDLHPVSIPVQGVLGNYLQQSVKLFIY